MKHANDNQSLTFISMFSGIEAASVAFGPLGWKATAFAEIEKFPAAVLAHHYPETPNVGDMTKHDWSQYAGQVDIVCGGPPCQAFSVAGLRNSMQDARGNLSLSYMRALHAIKPRNAIVENVPGWLNTPDNAFGCFLAGLVGADAPLESGLQRGRWTDAGMVDGPLGRAAWRIQDAQFHGLAQRRRRVLVVADFGNGADPAAVLFERYGMQGNTPPSREKGKDVAGTISARTKGGGGLGTDFDLDGGLVEAKHQWPAEVFPTLDTYYGDKMGLEDQHVFNQKGGKFVPAIAFGWQNSAHQGDGVSSEIVSTLDKSKTPAVTVAIRGREGGATAELGGEVATALRASQGGGDKAHVLAFVQNSRDEVRLMNGDGKLVGALAAQPGMKQQTFIATSAVRRLTPVECERLQGFPDGYTDIPWRGKDTSPDGPRYKALGNSWAVPKFAWLGERIARFMPASAATNKEHQRAA